MKVLVCGGRDFKDFKAVCDALDHYADEADALVHGGAAGADSLAQDWADLRGVPCLVYLANWKKYGRRAGPIRNQQMLDEQEPSLVVAFPGGRGTSDMVGRAIAAGIRVVEMTSAVTRPNGETP